ncbi:MAG: sodium-dependent transporter [Ruminococcaceae bacterium]|nr:sodium-dependent transporter [Oscillospiraceae bacterium]
MEKNRSSFTSKIGFVLAAAGSAVGLGNLWRFPYLAAQHGGGIFLLVYLILSVTFGFSLMVAEIAIGRKTGLSAIGAFNKINKKCSFIGYLAALVPALILPYYSVIGGWVIKYLTVFCTGGASTAAADGYFDGFIGNTWQSLLFFAIFIGVTAVVVLLGVEKGVEKVSKIMMPILVVISVGVAAFVCISNGIRGEWEGLLYYLKPDFSNFSIMTVVAAMGQLFYSMSLAMGIMITYGSYMKKDVNLESSAHQIEFFDMGIAFLAGLMIVPSVVSYSGIEGLNKGPGLMFVTLPKVFNEMGPVLGNVIGALFFVLVLFAALTSSISLMETVVSIIQDKFHLERKVSCSIVLGASFLIGLPSALGFGVWSGFTPMGMDILSFFDFITNSILMPIVAIMTCIVVCYVMKPQAIIDETSLTGKFKLAKLFKAMIYVAPVLLIIILIFAIFEAFGITFGGFLKF